MRLHVITSEMKEAAKMHSTDGRRRRRRRNLRLRIKLPNLGAVSGP